MASWAAQVLVRPEAPQWIRHPAGIDGAARSDPTLKKENFGKAAIVLSQVTVVPNSSQTTEDLPQDLQIQEGRQMSLLNSP